MKRLFAIASAGILWASIATSASAQMVTSTNPSSVVGVLQGAGYRAELTKDSSGDPMIKSTSSGSDFVVFFYNCTKNADCTTVQFFASYEKPKNGSLSALNDWNSKNRFARAYLADSGNARIEMDVDLDNGGMSRSLFEDNFNVWVAVMASFEKHIKGN